MTEKGKRGATYRPGIMKYKKKRSTSRILNTKKKGKVNSFQHKWQEETISFFFLIFFCFRNAK